MAYGGRPRRYRPGLVFLCACAILVISAGYARAARYRIDYSGTFISIFDADGNPGGSFGLGGGIGIDDTFSGTFSLDTDNAGPGDGPSPPSTATYDFGVEAPSLLLNGTQQLNLTPKVGLGVLDNVDPAITAYYGGGVRESGFDPLPASVDFLLLFTDVVGFDSTAGSESGYEVIWATFDPDALALSDIAIPDPLQPLSHSFLIYLETIDGTYSAAGFGSVEDLCISSVPEPSACLLVCTGVLALLGSGRTVRGLRGTTGRV